MPPCFEERVITARLPVELIVSIAEILAGDLCFESIANVNVTCRIVHEETLPVLYETLQLQYSQLKAEAIAAERSSDGTYSLPCGMGYARFLILENSPIEAALAQDIPSLHSIFPSLRFCLVKATRIMRWPYGERLRPCELLLYAGVDFGTLVGIFVSSNRARSRLPNAVDLIPERVNKVTVQGGGSISCTSPLASSRLHVMRTAVFSDRVSIIINCAKNENRQDHLTQDLLRLLQLILPEWSNSDVSSVVHITCAHAVLPHIMSLSGSLPYHIGLSVRVSDLGICASALRKLLNEGVKDFLASRKKLIREGKPDKENWTDVRKLERCRRAVWAMAVQVKAIGDTIAPDSSTADSLVDDSIQYANIYVYDARMPVEKADRGVEVILGFPELVGGVGFADILTDGRGVKLYSESCGV